MSMLLRSQALAKLYLGAQGRCKHMAGERGDRSAALALGHALGLWAGASPSPSVLQLAASSASVSWSPTLDRGVDTDPPPQLPMHRWTSAGDGGMCNMHGCVKQRSQLLPLRRMTRRLLTRPKRMSACGAYRNNREMLCALHLNIQTLVGCCPFSHCLQTSYAAQLKCFKQRPGIVPLRPIRTLGPPPEQRRPARPHTWRSAGQPRPGPTPSRGSGRRPARSHAPARGPPPGGLPSATTPAFNSLNSRSRRANCAAADSTPRGGRPLPVAPAAARPHGV